MFRRIFVVNFERFLNRASEFTDKISVRIFRNILYFMKQPYNSDALF